MIRVYAGRPWPNTKLETAWSIQEFRGMALGLIFGVSSVIFAPFSQRMFKYTLWDCPLMYSLNRFPKNSIYLCALRVNSSLMFH